MSQGWDSKIKMLNSEIILQIKSLKNIFFGEFRICLPKNILKAWNCDSSARFSKNAPFQ